MRLGVSSASSAFQVKQPFKAANSETQCDFKIKSFSHVLNSISLLCLYFRRRLYAHVGDVFPIITTVQRLFHLHLASLLPFLH
jgi:hypothetical protein